MLHLVLAVDDAVDHLLHVGADSWHVHVEVDLGIRRCPCDFHQTVDTDVVARESTTQLQVCKIHGIEHILCFEVEVGIAWITAKSDGTALLEGEVTLDDVLDGQFIDATIYNVVTIEFHATFIIIGGANDACTVQVDIVSACLVHDDLQRSVGCGMDEEVDMYVGRHIFRFCVVVRGRRSVDQLGLERVSGYPLDKLLRANRFRTGDVVTHHGPMGRGSVYFDIYFPRLTVDVDGACSGNSSIDRIAIVRTKIITNQVVGFDMEVVAQV